MNGSETAANQCAVFDNTMRVLLNFHSQVLVQDCLAAFR